MARSQEKETLRGSLLDRLTGDFGAGSTFGAINHSDLKRALQRDLNWLLNTRSWLPDDLSDLPETRSSMLTFGLPDFTSMSWKRAGDQKLICSVLEEALRDYEPRLIGRTIKVVPVEDDDEVRLTVKLRIDAILNVEPYTEPVSFDTEIEIDSGAVNVKGAM